MAKKEIKDCFCRLLETRWLSSEEITIGRTHVTLMVLLFSIFASFGPAHAQQWPAYGYQVLTDPQTTGGVVLAQRPAAAGSATALLAQGFKEVATFFDGRPRALGGFQDAYDQRAEVVFQAMLRRSPVSGVAFATVGAGGGAVGFAFDSPRTIAQSLPRLMQLAGGPGGGPGTTLAHTLNWREVPFPDGSGWMRLPDGWQITFAQKGMVSAMGPHGAVERGVSNPAKTRAGAAQYNALAVPFGGRPYSAFVADPTDPLSALQALMLRYGENIIRVIQVAPFQAPNFPQSAYIDYEYERGGLRSRSIRLSNAGNRHHGWNLASLYFLCRITR